MPASTQKQLHHPRLGLVGGKKTLTSKGTHVPVKGPAILKKRTFKKRPPGTMALREIQKYQKSTELTIPHAPFTRLIKDIANDVINHGHFQNGARMHTYAKKAIQEAIEYYTIKLLEDALLNAIHGKRITVEPKDIQLALRVRGERA